MDILFTGCITGILEKYADPILKKAVEISKDEWEKFKVDFDISFRDYLKNSYDKYSRIKTILYRTEPKYIYDFFEIPFLKKERNNGFKANDANSVLNISNFVIIQGTGGIGKSTLMKHLFINELEQKDLIPIFIELKDINDLEKDYEINDIIFEKLDNLGSKLNEKYLEYALKSGCFMFLLDGYDGILSQKKDVFFKKLDSFCDKYPKNFYIISSRPYSEFIEFQRFTVLATCPLNKNQAISLINKIEFDADIKRRFVSALDDELYEKHLSFASNPLLLNIMLLTYDNYAEIPEKLHLFYANAFETLYSKHDATKAGYRRELRSNLSYDSFKKIFSCFCFVSYAQGKIEFTYDDLVIILKKASISRIIFDIDNYIFDLVNSLCVLYKDGINYKFAHRSFQEYFVALFLKELSDDSMKQMGMQVFYKDVYRANHDSVFNMLCDMAEERFEQNILLPIIQDFEKDVLDDKYDFYFNKYVQDIRFDIENDEDSNKIELWLTREVNRDVDNNIVEFIYRYTYYYVEGSKTDTEDIRNASDRALRYLIDNRDYMLGQSISGENIIKDGILYSLIKETWIGKRLNIMSSLSEELKKKQDQNEVDLSNLLDL